MRPFGGALSHRASSELTEIRHFVLPSVGEGVTVSVCSIRRAVLQRPADLSFQNLKMKVSPISRVSVKIDSHTAFVTARTRSEADCTVPPAAGARRRGLLF